MPFLPSSGPDSCVGPTGLCPAAKKTRRGKRMPSGNFLPSTSRARARYAFHCVSESSMRSARPGCAHLPRCDHGLNTHRMNSNVRVFAAHAVEPARHEQRRPGRPRAKSAAHPAERAVRHRRSVRAARIRSRPPTRHALYSSSEGDHAESATRPPSRSTRRMSRRAASGSSTCVKTNAETDGVEDAVKKRQVRQRAANQM